MNPPQKQRVHPHLRKAAKSTERSAKMAKFPEQTETGNRNPTKKQAKIERGAARACLVPFAKSTTLTSEGWCTGADGLEQIR